MVDKPQVFLRAEVVTREDLLAIRNGYGYLYANSTGEQQYQFIIAMGVVQQIIDYLDRGKTDFQGNKT